MSAPTIFDADISAKYKVVSQLVCLVQFHFLDKIKEAHFWQNHYYCELIVINHSYCCELFFLATLVALHFTPVSESVSNSFGLA